MLKKTNHIMISLEKLDKAHTAAIAAIGAVAFEPSTGEVIADFYCRVDIESSQNQGGTIGADTVKWWLRRPSDARAEIVCENAQTIAESLRDLNSFILRHTYCGQVYLWAKGTDLDLPILVSAMQRCNLILVWSHWLARDVCTFTEVAFITGMPTCGNIPFEGIPHHALSDARHQAKIVSSIWQGLTALQFTQSEVD